MNNAPTASTRSTKISFRCCARGCRSRHCDEGTVEWTIGDYLSQFDAQGCLEDTDDYLDRLDLTGENREIIQRYLEESADHDARLAGIDSTYTETFCGPSLGSRVLATSLECAL